MDFIGSISSSTTVWLTCLHAGHSNVRMSKPMGPGVTRASTVLVWHVGQIGRRMGMMLSPLFRRERYRTLSHR